MDDKKSNKSKRALSIDSPSAKTLDRVSAIERAIASMSRPSALEKAMESLNAIEKTMAAISRPSGLEQALDSFHSNQLAIEKAVAAISRPSALEQAMESWKSIEKTMAAISRPYALDKVLDSFSSNQLAIEKAVASIAQPSAIQKALDSLNSHQSAVAKLMESVGNSSAIENMLANLDSQDFENIDDELAIAADQLNETDTQNSYLSVFKNLPPAIQAIFFYILLNVIIPQINSISANILTPVVSSYLEESDLTKREEIKNIKDIPRYLDNVQVDGLRFITGDNVRLREGPSTKSDILDELVLGQVVSILSKDRNWIEVMYEYEDGEVLSGWVFTRYTSKFRK